MKNDTQIKNIELIKRLVGEYVNNSRYARFIEFVESDDSEKNSYLDVIFDCAGYFAIVTYKYFAHTDGIKKRAKYKFEDFAEAIYNKNK